MSAIDPPLPWPTGDSYAQWLRRVLIAARDPGRPLYTLFDSSTAEPTVLIAEVLKEAFGGPTITSRYQSVFAGGNQALLSVLAGRYGVDRGCIVATPGATSALGIVYRAYLDAGDRVLVESPGFDLFGDLAASMGVHVDTFNRAPDGGIDIEGLVAAIRPATRLIVLSDLHNPTGRMLDHAALARVAVLAAQRGIDLVVDEVYREFAADPIDTAAHISPNIVVINSVTKVFGLSALRCGWVIAHPTRIDRLHAVHSRLEFASSKVTHAAAALILERPDRFEAHWRSLLANARPVVAEALSRWSAAGWSDGDVPPHGCIVFPRLIGIDDTRAFSEWLAARCGVVVAPGEYFGAPGHVRIGFSRDADSLRTALEHVGEGLAAYRSRATVALKRVAV